MNHKHACVNGLLSVTRVCSNGVENCNIEATMAAELIRIGILQEGEYLGMLRRLCDGSEVTAATCEWVLEALRTWEEGRPDGERVHQENKLQVYSDLLEKCLMPCLLGMLGSHSIKHNTPQYHIAHVSVVSNDSVRTAKDKKNTKEMDNGVTSISNDILNNTIKEKGSEMNELKLIPKLSYLVSYLLSVLSRSPCDIRIIDSKDVVLKELLETIYLNLSELCLDGIIIENELHRIKILSLAFSNLLKDDLYKETDVLIQYVRKVIETALSLVKASHDADITALLLTLVIQPCIENQKMKDDIIISLWHTVKGFYISGEDFITEEKNSTGFIVLCFLSEHIFKANLVLENEDMFWKIIQYGLIHTNPLSRKRSQYILKRAVDMYTSLNSSHACSVSKYMPFQSKRLKELERLWYDFFLLIETLEEKQAHVVKPVLEKLDKLISESIKNGNREMHISWILIIFHRVFSHDNKSIRQWGLTKFLKLKLPEEVLVNGFLSFVTLHLVSVLSDYSYFARYPGQPRRMSSSVGDHLVLFFTNTVDSLSLSMQKYFMCSILETIFDGRPWGAVPLFYMIRSLSQIPSTRVWNYKVVKNAVVNFEGCLSTQDVSLRSASQCDFLKAVLKHLSSETTLIEICDIIGHLRRKESWCRGTSIWDTVIESLDIFADNYENSSVHAALAASMSSLHSWDVAHPPDVALGINFLMEKYYKMNEKHKSNFLAESLLKTLTDFLKDCHLRPYLDQKKLAWTLEVLAVTLQIMYEIPANNLEVEKKHDGDLSCFVDGIISVTQLFINHIDKFNQPHDLDMIKLYLRVFAACNSSTPLKLAMKNHYIQIFIKCKSLLEKIDPVKVSFGIIIMEHLLLFHFGDSKNNIKEEYHQTVLQKIIHDIQPLTQRRTIEGYKSSEITSSLLLETTRSCWSSVDMLIRKKEMSFIGILEETEKSVVAILPDAVSTVGRLNAQHVYQVAVNVAPAIIKAGIWQDLVEHMWTSSSEFKKGCDLYRFLICCITDLLFHRDAMVKPEWQEFIVKISQKLLIAGEAVQGIAAYMSRSLVLTLSDLAASDALTSEAMSLFTQEIFVPLTMFGYVFKKQFRVIQDTIEYIKDCGTNYSSNILLESNWDADQKARAITLRFLLSLSKESPVDKQIARAITQGIRFQYMKCSGDRRDYGNSQTHRYKTRLLQAFMLLLPLLDEEECLLSLSWLCRGLIKDHQQPSVRYMQEWGVSLIIIFHPNFYPRLLKHFSEGAKERVGCVGSFLAALTHVACTTEDQEVLSQSIQYSLPWCMAQHFNTRLYAQVSLRKIWHHCRIVNATRVLEKFEPIQQCLQFVVEQGSAARNTLNMLNDFYFKVFHPVQHYTLQTIVYDLPSLSLLADDEWMKVDFIMCAVNLSMLPVRSEIPLHNKDKVLEESAPAPWVVKAAGESAVAEESEMIENSILNVQRKITPWKSMISELTASLDLPNMDEPRQQRGSLILIASLIDKPPNLGGLCRTCEVFSVREYIVPSLGVLEDQTFNSLSLTAQQWVPVKEVKPDDLAAYLKTLQNDGYTLVAAEQTANSKKLSEFSFPERTAVILGNEREGIPCELLQLLDVCVEIPQSGIIRSLNVHVSGALFIWEYTRQHMIRLTSV